MGTPAPLRVAAAPAQSRHAAPEPAPADKRDFLSLLGAPAAADGADAESTSETREECGGEARPEGLAPLLAGFFPPPPTGDGESAAGQSAGEEALSGIELSGDALPGDAALTADGLAQALEADQLQEALLGRIAAEKMAGEGKAGLADNALRQLDLLMAGDKGESQSGLRLPAAEVPGLMVQAAAGSSAVTLAPASSATSLEQALRANVGTPRWADELGTRLVMMSARGQQEGSLTLSPEHLGPLEVRISVQQSTANVWFGAQHADTRAALAEAMPRLRELFGEAGLSLGHAGVSEEAPRQSAGGDTESIGTERAADGAPVQPAAVAVRQVTSALLDLYA
jgi:flagellar hook-length control protein FliK